MTTFLLATTIFASAIAIAALLAVFVAFREERRRSEARVEALRLMTAGDEPASSLDVSPMDFDEITSPDDSIVTRQMFNEDTAPSPWGRRIAAAAAMAVIVAIAGYVLVPRRAATDAAGPAASATTAAAPLELLSLRHTQQDSRLVITGLVQNPRGAAPLHRIVATAFLFSADGTFLASGRAPLDFSTLAAGDESPFVVTVPVSGVVARYRVGFRSEDGKVIGHVDRRASGSLARGE